MDWIVDQALAAIARVIALFANWGHGMKLVYLASALAIGAGFIALRRRRNGGGSRRSLVAELLPRRILMHPSCQRDYAILALNAGIFFFFTLPFVLPHTVFAGLLLSASEVAGVDVPAPTNAIGWQLLFSLYMLLVWDFVATSSHYLKHRIPVLWEFHKVHHSAEAMTPVTNYRRHPVDFLFSSIIIVTGTGLALALWVQVFGYAGPVLAYYGMPAALAVWYLLGYNLRHSHMWICYGPFWSRILISPAQHQIHHSREARHYDTNFGLVFAFWDRLYGTLYVPDRKEAIRFGIEPEEMAGYRTLKGLYLTPFVNVARRLRGGSDPR